MHESSDKIGLQQMLQQLHQLKQLPRTGWAVRGIPVVETVGAHSYGVALWTLWLAQRQNLREPGSIDVAKALSMALVHDLPESSTGDLMPIQKALLFGDDPRAQKEAIFQAERRYWRLLRTSQHDEPSARTPTSAPCQEHAAPCHSSTSSPQSTQSGAGHAPGSDTGGAEPASGTAGVSPVSDMGGAVSSCDALRAEHAKILALWEGSWASYREGDCPEAKIVKQADALDCVMQAIAYRSRYKTSLEAFARLLPKAAGGDPALLQELQRLWEEEKA